MSVPYATTAAVAASSTIPGNGLYGHGYMMSEPQLLAHFAQLVASSEVEDLWYYIQDLGYCRLIQIFPRYLHKDPRPKKRVCQGGNDCHKRPGPGRAGKMSDLEPWFQLGPVVVSIYDYLLPLPINSPVSLPCSCPPETIEGQPVFRRTHTQHCNANTSLNGWYVASLTPTWVSQCGDISGHWFDAPAPNRRGAAGVKGIYGCTAIIIVSEVGAYISHIWECPAFVHRNHKRKTIKEIEQSIWGPLRDGTERGCVLSITSLVGTRQSPGPLHFTKNPRVIIVTPWKCNPEGGTRLQLRHEKALKVIRKGLESFFGRWISEIGYHVTDEVKSTEVGFLGRAIVEFDMAKPGVYVDYNGLTWQMGRWRVWVEDKIVARHEFWINYRHAPVYRVANAQVYPGPPSCFCWCTLQPELHPQHHEWDEQIRAVLRPPEEITEGDENRTKNPCTIC